MRTRGWMRRVSWNRASLSTFSAVLVFFSSEAAANFRLPNINYSGQLRAAHRYTLDQDGKDALQNTWTGRLAANGYAWRPWLMTWAGSFNASKILTYSDVDTSGSVLSGDGRAQLFPKSRFPLRGFASVQDTRLDFDDFFADSADSRITRFGLQQQYLPVSGRSAFTFAWDRNIHDDLGGDDKDQSSDVVRIRAKHRTRRQSFSADFDYLDNRFAAESDESAWSTVARHRYEPGEQLSLESFISLSGVMAKDDLESASGEHLTAQSIGYWRHSTRPLQVSGRFNLNAGWNDGSTEDGEGFEDGALTLSSRYEMIDHLHVTGDLGLRLRSLGDEIGVSFLQGLGASYTPDSIDIREFAYNYSLSLSGTNDYLGSAGSIQSLNGAAGHGLSRFFRFSSASPWAFGFDIGQQFSIQSASDRLGQSNLIHRISLSASRRRGGKSTQIRTWALDTRRFGGIESDSQIVNFTVAHSHAINDVSEWSTSGTISYVRTDAAAVDQEDTGTSPISLDVEYRNRRLFKVKLLRYRATLRFEANEITSLVPGESGARLGVQNRFDYMLGMIEMQLRLLTTNPGPQAVHSFFFMISRSF